MGTTDGPKTSDPSFLEPLGVAGPGLTQQEFKQHLNLLAESEMGRFAGSQKAPFGLQFQTLSRHLLSKYGGIFNRFWHSNPPAALLEQY